MPMDWIRWSILHAHVESVKACYILETSPHPKASVKAHALAPKRVLFKSQIRTYFAGSHQAKSAGNLNFAALHQVYCFEDQDCNDLQASALCDALVLSICDCIPTPRQVSLKNLISSAHL